VPILSVTSFSFGFKLLDCYYSTAILSLTSYLEIVMLSFERGRPLSFDRSYLGERRAGFQKGQKALEGTFRSLGHDLDITLREISNPPGELEELGLAIGPIPIPNSLDPSPYPYMNVMNHRERFPLSFHNGTSFLLRPQRKVEGVRI